MKFIDQLKQSLADLWQTIASAFPKVLAAIVSIVIALLVIKLITGILRKALKLMRADRLDDKLNEIEIVQGKELSFSIIDVVIKSVKWILYIVLIFIITDILELTMVADGLKNLLGYLPKLFTALAIFVLGLIFANTVKKSLQSFFDSMDLSGAKIISQVVFFLILIFVSITALNQAGIDTDIITSNITMILGALLVAFAIAFGLGAKHVVGKLMHSFYARKMYETGQKIVFNDMTYEIDEVKSISIVLKNENGKLVVPINDLMEHQVQLQDQL